MERGEELFQKVKNQGEKAIDEFIDTRQTEELFLDFKRSADDGNGTRLHDRDRNNLAKAISGFGNSEGGVVVWGVDCSKDYDGSDVAKAKHPIINVNRFVSWLNGAISGCTVPSHNGVQNHPVGIGQEGKGYIVTYIPKSDHAPHQEIPSRKYYIRAGSDFSPTPHDVLAGMFGRRPQPSIMVKPKYRFVSKLSPDGCIIEYLFYIGNEGKGIAEDLFASIFVPFPGGDKCKCLLKPPNRDSIQYDGEASSSVIIKRDTWLPPGGSLLIASLDIYLRPPLTKLEVIVTIGCGNAPPVRLVFGNARSKVQEWYNSINETLKTRSQVKEEAEERTNDLLGIAESTES